MSDYGFEFQRSSGVLLHPTSLPGPDGIGDLGQSAFSFVDWLHRHGQSIWQILPLGPTSYGDSPYQTLSAFAGNPLLISMEHLVEAGVSMCIGTDGVRDIWSGLNSVDMLDRIKMLGYRCRFKRDDDFEMLLGLATTGGARVMGDQNYGFEEGKHADFIVLPGGHPKEVIVDQPKRTYVFKRGKLVAADGECLIPE